MPSAVRRWHLVWSKKPWSARNLNEFTVAGVFAASIVMPMSPQVVRSVKEYVALLSMSIAGAVFHCCLPGVPAAGLAHGSGTLAGVVAGGVADAVAAASFFDPSLPSRL